MSENTGSSQEETTIETTEAVLTQDDKTMGMLCHLSALAGFVIPLGAIFGPLIVWLLKKDQSPFIDENGKESLNFQITMLIAYIISAILIFVIIGFFLLFGLAVFSLVMVIIAAIKANDGETYRYPFNFRLIK
jgi:uncharacterized protein